MTILHVIIVFLCRIIPVALGALTDLTTLNLSCNQLTGEAATCSLVCSVQPGILTMQWPACLDVGRKLNRRRSPFEDIVSRDLCGVVNQIKPDFNAVCH